MEWERKFYDIVRETESTLASARLKLLGHGSSNHPTSQIQTTEKPPSSSSSSSPAYQPTAWTSYINDNDHINAIRRHMGWTQPSTSQADAMPGTSLRGTFGSELRELQTKMDSQTLVIEKLEQLVKSLSQEKDQYRRQIKDLQNEVSDLSTHLLDKGSPLDPQLKTQVDRVRQEFRSDLERLQGVIGASRPGTQYSNRLERSFHDMQKSVHSELEELRRDLNSMIHRVGKLELDVSCHSTGHRAQQSRPCEVKSETSIHRPHHSGRSPAVLRMHSPALTAGDMFHVKELRNTVSQLHNKLDSLEGRVAASQASSPLVASTGHTHTSSPLLTSILVDKPRERPAPSLPRSNVKVTFQDFLDDEEDDDDNNGDLDDLDLAEDFDLDLPVDNPKLSDELEDIVTIRGVTEGDGRASLDLLGIFEEDVLDDEMDPLGLSRPASTERKTPGCSPLQTQTKEWETTPAFQKPSFSRPGQDAAFSAELLSDLYLDHLDLDTSSADPLDLDSLDEMSGDLNLNDLLE